MEVAEPKKEKIEIAKLDKMYFVKNTRVYTTKSNLDGPVYGPYVVVLANQVATVTKTQFKDVVQIQTDSGVKGFVKQDRLKNLQTAND